MLNPFKNKQLITVGTLILTALFILGLSAVAKTNASVSWQEKVDPLVLEMAGSAEGVEFLVVLREQADLSGSSKYHTKEGKGAFVYEQLTAVAQRTQPALILALQNLHADYRQYWVSNMIWVKGNAAIVEAIARRPDVARVYGNPQVQLDTVTPVMDAEQVDGQSAVEWNIALVKAPDVWGAGITGTGIVIGGQDTGYDWNHPALKTQYRGWDGQTADHDYNWHDAIHENNSATPPGNPCGFDSAEPCDDHGHGTHTMGTMVGDDQAGNQIGMAPGARWIACRNMEQGWGSPASYSECYQWFIAPYPLGGDPMTDGDPTKAPNVINNSWSCPSSEGCSNPDILREIVANVRAAGIVTVHAASNEGPACSTISSAAAIYDASYSVAATDGQDLIAGFSSRGPVNLKGYDPAKPDISAPGVSIRSSKPGNQYGVSSGTSMAAPHVAGLVALLLDARPDLAGQVDLLEATIGTSAKHLLTNQGCGGDDPTSIPNHVYGWGRIDAWQAYQQILGVTNPPGGTATPTSSPVPTSTPAASPTAGTPELPLTTYLPVWLVP